MKNVLKFAFALVMLTAISVSINAQEKEEENPFDVTTDLMSRYVWRGTDFGASPSIQPGFSYTKGGFTVGTWGAYTINAPGTQEVDIYLDYTFLNEMISLGFTDYFFPNEMAGNDHYFEYGEDKTGHVYELSIAFNGTENLPLGFLVATNLYGADAKRLNDDGTIAGNQYSTYAELSYGFKHIDVFAGFNIITPDTDKGESGFYGDYFGFVNIGCTVNKDIKISDSFNLPLSASLITNPQTEKIFLVAGFSF